MKLKKSGKTALIVLVSLITIIGLSDFIFLVKTPTNETLQPQNQSLTMEKLTLTTSDNKSIAAALWPVKNPKAWIILVHMMPATKESWTDLAQALQNEGYESVAVDLRGHGESEGGPQGYQSFSDSEHQKSILDLNAAAKYLLDGGATPDKIIFIGASIGANLSLQYIAEHSESKTAVLLSPGINYRGIETEPRAKKLKTGQKVFMIGAKDDERSGGNIVNQINKISEVFPAGVQKEIKIYDTGGHGTDIVKNHPDMIKLIVDFIK